MQFDWIGDLHSQKISWMQGLPVPDFPVSLSAAGETSGSIPLLKLQRPVSNGFYISCKKNII